MNENTQSNNQSKSKSASVNTHLPNQNENSLTNTQKKIKLLILLMIFLVIVILATGFLSNKFKKQAKNTTLPSNQGESINFDNNISDDNQNEINLQENEIGIEFQSPISVKKNQTFDILLVVNPNSKNITGLDMRILYPQDAIEIESAQTSVSALPITLKGPIIAHGQVDMIVGASPTQTLSAIATIVTLKAKAMHTGPIQISLSNDSRATALTFRDYLNIKSTPLHISVK